MSDQAPDFNDSYDIDLGPRYDDYPSAESEIAHKTSHLDLAATADIYDLQVAVSLPPNVLEAALRHAIEINNSPVIGFLAGVAVSHVQTMTEHEADRLLIDQYASVAEIALAHFRSQEESLLADLDKEFPEQLDNRGEV